jgi:hypothetical protein
MWTRKSNEQLARERRRIWLSFSGPAALFVICFIANLGIAMRGPLLGGRSGRWPDTWSLMFGVSAFVGAFAAIAGYALQVILGRKLVSLTEYGKIVICDTCHRVKHGDRERKCECGGAFDNFDHWTWLDEDGNGHRIYTGNGESGLILRPPVNK